MTWTLPVLPPGSRLVAGLVVALLAFGACFYAGWSWNGSRWEAKYQGDLVRMYQAGVAANKRATETYRADLQAIRDRPRPVRRVYLCPDQAAAPGGAAGPGAPGLPGAPGRDLGPDLYQLADDADRCAAQLDALIRATE